MLTRILAFDLRPDGIVVLAMHPGWVHTDMGGCSAPVAPAESAQGILRVADELTMADTGAFYTYQGREVPW
jgi:NAD(P)-dependent dehydrogenase (short-subunit alcohol dehydrogenase family)